jgi:hypothetical protein
MGGRRMEAARAARSTDEETSRTRMATKVESRRPRRLGWTPSRRALPVGA